MKKALAVFVGLILFSVSAHAEPGDDMKSMKMDRPCNNMPQKCPMMGDQPMPMKTPMSGMMHSMIDMMKMQQKMLKGLTAAEKKAMVIEMDKKIERMEKMMADMPCMPPSPSLHEHEAMGK